MFSVIMNLSIAIKVLLYSFSFTYLFQSCDIAEFVGCYPYFFMIPQVYIVLALHEFIVPTLIFCTGKVLPWSEAGL